MLISKVKKLSPKERFHYWISEREKIRLAKEEGKPPPWTDDEILQSYRFTNTRRMDDYVSNWLMEQWYTPYFNHKSMLVAVALARFVNQPRSLEGTYLYLFKKPKPELEKIKKHLKYVRDNLGETVFRAAYMVRGGKPGGDKIEEVIDIYVKPLLDNPPILYQDSMELTHWEISRCYGFGSFMAGQVVADLRWAIEGTWEDKDYWAPLGPGSRRGMNRYLGRDVEAKMDQDEFETHLLELIKDCQDNLPGEITSRLEAQDFQSVCCETDKYNRALLGEGRPKQLYRGRG